MIGVIHYIGEGRGRGGVGIFLYFTFLFDAPAKKTTSS